AAAPAVSRARRGPSPPASATARLRPSPKVRPSRLRPATLQPKPRLPSNRRHPPTPAGPCPAGAAEPARHAGPALRGRHGATEITQIPRTPMTISATQVKELRERTGAGMMECKKSLTETGGDMDAAIEWLRMQGLAKADKKASRVAAEGRIGLA